MNFRNQTVEAIVLDGLQNLLLELTLDLLALVVGRRFTVKVEESAEVEFGCLEKLDLADVDLKNQRVRIRRTKHLSMASALTFCRG